MAKIKCLRSVLELESKRFPSNPVIAYSQISRWEIHVLKCNTSRHREVRPALFQLRDSATLCQRMQTFYDSRVGLSAPSFEGNHSKS